MLIHSLLENSTANGPGNRAVIHFQGCALACPGCWNPDTHNFENKMEKPLEDVLNWVVSNKDIEGVTFSGGEPMQQAPQLYLLVYKIKEQRPDLSIGMYTGYSLQELEAGKYRWKSAVDSSWQAGTRQLWLEIKKLMDFAVMGRYNQQKHTTALPLLGSSNQTLEFFTDRYSMKDMSEQEVEVTIGEDGLIQITGFPNQEFLQEFDSPKEVETSHAKKASAGDDPELVCA